VKLETIALSSKRPYSVAVERRESLPFRVRLAESSQDIEKAVEIRAAAYARHVPGLGDALRRPEPDDLRPDALLLIAEGKLDGDVVGSLRLQHNFDRRLRIEGELTLPDVYQGKRLVEVRRLGVGNGTSGKMVMAALVKAAYELCHAASIDYLIFGARQSVASMYRAMHFDDVLNGGTIRLSYADDVPHSIFSLPVRDADRRWRTTGYSLYEFAARTEHPDIQIDYERVSAVFGLR
jgi:hypothetical protein